MLLKRCVALTFEIFNSEYFATPDKSYNNNLHNPRLGASILEKSLVARSTTIDLLNIV